MTCIFFFFTQKTAYEISTRDWSSDVCSSDLLHVVDQLGDVLDRQLGIDDQEIGEADELGDRLQILVDVERQLGIERRVERDRADGAKQQRVAVRRGLGDKASADATAGAGAVLDHDVLAELRLHVGGKDARQQIGRATRAA